METAWIFITENSSYAVNATLGVMNHLDDYFSAQVKINPTLII